MSGHTPGPWTCHGVTFEDCNPNSAAYIIECADGMPASRANASLIAAAPELLEALGGLLGPLNVCSDNKNVGDDVLLPVDMTMGELRKCRAAIAKAKGGAA